MGCCAQLLLFQSLHAELWSYTYRRVCIGMFVQFWCFEKYSLIFDCHVCLQIEENKCLSIYKHFFSAWRPLGISFIPPTSNWEASSQFTRIRFWFLREIKVFMMLFFYSSISWHAFQSLYWNWIFSYSFVDFHDDCHK